MNRGRGRATGSKLESVRQSESKTECTAYAGIGSRVEKEPQEPAVYACSRQRQEQNWGEKSPSSRRVTRDWMQLRTSGAAGEGSTRTKVQGVFFPGATRLG